MRPKKNTIPIFIAFAGFLYLILLLYGCHMGHCLHNNTYENHYYLYALIDGLEAFESHPLLIFPFYKETLSAILFLTVIFIIIFSALLYIMTIENVETKDTEGSNNWLTSGQLNQKIMHIADPEDKRPKSENSNIIYSANVRVGMEASEPDNNSAFIIGASGSRKTTGFVIPNILRDYGSMVVLDPKGELYIKTAAEKKRQGYEVKWFNIADMAHSDYYNPFNYIHSTDDLNRMVESLINNTDGGEKEGDKDFWDKAERNILSAVVAILVWGDNLKQSSKVLESQNYFGAFQLFRGATEQIKDSSGKVSKDTKFDQIFLRLKADKKDHPACMYYDAYATGTDKTRLSVLTSIMTRLRFVIEPNFRNIISRDNLEIDKLGERKQIIYITNPQQRKEYRFMVNILLTQIMDELERCSKRNESQGCPVPVTLMLEEAGSCGKLPSIDEYLAVCRGFRVNIAFIFQNLGQLKLHYKDNFEGILSNCWTKMILKANDLETAKYFSDYLGYRTQKTRSKQRNMGKGGVSDHDQQKGRLLMQPAELTSMKKTECCLIVGSDRIFDEKFNLYQSPLMSKIKQSQNEYKKIRPNSPLTPDIENLSREAAKNCDNLNNEQPVNQAVSNPRPVEEEIEKEQAKGKAEGVLVGWLTRCGISFGITRRKEDPTENAEIEEPSENIPQDAEESPAKAEETPEEPVEQSANEEKEPEKKPVLPEPGILKKKTPEPTPQPEEKPAEPIIKADPGVFDKFATGNNYTGSVELTPEMRILLGLPPMPEKETAAESQKPVNKEQPKSDEAEAQASQTTGSTLKDNMDIFTAADADTVNESQDGYQGDDPDRDDELI